MKDRNETKPNAKLGKMHKKLKITTTILIPKYMYAKKF